MMIFEGRVYKIEGQKLKEWIRLQEILDCSVSKYTNYYILLLIYYICTGIHQRQKLLCKKRDFVRSRLYRNNYVRGL